MTADLRALLEKAAVAAEAARESRYIEDARSSAAECVEILDKVLTVREARNGGTV
jgi:hypothetical protein